MGDEFRKPALQRRGAKQFQPAGGEQGKRPLDGLHHGNDMQAGMRMRVRVVILLGHASVAMLANGHDASDM